MVFGEPGLGKPRLLGEAAALARAEGATVCFGTCYEREGRPPYAPWDEVLTQYARALEPGSFPQGVRESAAIVAPVVPEFDWAVDAEPERLETRDQRPHGGAASRHDLPQDRGEEPDRSYSFRVQVWPREYIARLQGLWDA